MQEGLADNTYIELRRGTTLQVCYLGLDKYIKEISIFISIQYLKIIPRR
jgi:hypothetical protein